MNYEYFDLKTLHVKRELFHIEIRKNKINDLFSQKRMRCRALAVECDQTDDILQSWHHNLIDNQDVDVTLMKIRDFLGNHEKLEMRLKRFQQFEIYPTILMRFDESQDIDQANDLLFILSNCHSKDLYNDMALLKRKKTMNKILSIFEYKEYQFLQKHVFFLLGNLIGLDDGRKVGILRDDYNIIKRIINLWKDQNICLELDSIQDFLWFLENLIHYDQRNCQCLTSDDVIIINIKLKTILPIYYEFVRQTNPELLKAALCGILQIVRQKESTIDCIVMEKEIVDILFDKCFDSDDSVSIQAIRTTFGLLLGSNDAEQILIQYGILNLMERIYVRPFEENKQMVIWALGNLLTSQRKENIIAIINSNIFKRILNDFKTLETEILRQEVIMMLRGFKSLDNYDLMRLSIMQTKLVDILMDVLSETYDFRQLTEALKIILNMHDKTQTYSSNLAKEMFEIQGIKKLLDRLFLMESEEVQELVIILQEQYYY